MSNATLGQVCHTFKPDYYILLPYLTHLRLTCPSTNLQSFAGPAGPGIPWVKGVKALPKPQPSGRKHSLSARSRTAMSFCAPCVCPENQSTTCHLGCQWRSIKLDILCRARTLGVIPYALAWTSPAWFLTGMGKKQSNPWKNIYQKWAHKTQKYFACSFCCSHCNPNWKDIGGHIKAIIPLHPWYIAWESTLNRSSRCNCPMSSSSFS